MWRLDPIPLSIKPRGPTSMTLYWRGVGACTVTVLRCTWNSDGSIASVATSTEKREKAIRGCDACGKSDVDVGDWDETRKVYCCRQCAANGKQRGRRTPEKDYRSYWPVLTLVHGSLAGEPTFKGATAGDRMGMTLYRSGRAGRDIGGTKMVRAGKPLQRRACLRCDAKFLSEGPDNRLCETCRRKPAPAEAYTLGAL